MTQLGEIIRGLDIGKKGDDKYIWHECPKCKNQRWAFLSHGIARYPLCRSCSSKLLIGERGRNWKGGRYKDSHFGYILLYVKKDSPYYPMVDKDGYIKEHRLVMAQYLGRCLQSWEIVHHKNGIKDDNRIENLTLNTNRSEHFSSHLSGYNDGYLKGYTDGRSKRIKELQRENDKLRNALSQRGE